MHLLTLHGSVVGLPDATGNFKHHPLPLDSEAPLPLDLPTEFLDGGGRDPILGSVRLRPASRSGAFHLQRDGLFMCAEIPSRRIVFDRVRADRWETFLPIEPADLADLQQILRHRWIERATRRVIRRSALKLTQDFTLQLGDTIFDLTQKLGLFVTERGPGGEAMRLLLPRGDQSVELVIAEPRSSALLNTAIWPVRARRTAELLTIAVHRHINGVEPTQEILERDAAFLEARRGAAGLEDLLELYTDENNAGAPQVSTPAAIATGLLPTPNGSADTLHPIIPLGITCITACVVRQAGLMPFPLPFNWLETSPAMVRHCLETDFETLLDRSYYQSLAGLAQEGEPKEGCAHSYYKQEFGLRRVFNHIDPTNDAAYRYIQTCVDRLRALMASTAPKLFVQCRWADGATREDFRKTSDLLDSLTKPAALLQIEILDADFRLAAPLLSVAARKGRHVLYGLQPTSHMGGEFFRADVDNAFLGWLIVNHARQKIGTETDAAASGAARGAGIHQFGFDRTKETLVTLENANASLARFLATAEIAPRFSFGMFDRSAIGAHVHGEACLVEITHNLQAEPSVTLRFAEDQPLDWTIMHRSLSLISMIDVMLRNTHVPGTRFLAEIGDAGYLRSVSFCSKVADCCLVPDSDFVSSGGYRDMRDLVATRGIPWAERQPKAFWRGSTTGIRRKAPPPDGEADDFTWLPRLDLCRRARDSAAFANYDVGISNICQIDEPHLVARIEAARLCRPPAPRETFLGYKAILVIDGNSNPWSALFCALLTGACVLLVKSPGGYRQWYYDKLKPLVHFIPVASDLRDLDRVVNWVLNNDDAAQAIGEAGRKFAEKLTLEVAMEDAAERMRDWISKARV
jgi:hypothetical protein